MTQDDLEHLLVCSTRYCLGRQSYVVGEQCRILRECWDELGPGARQVIETKVESAIAAGQAGMEQDQREWERLAKDLWR